MPEPSVILLDQTDGMVDVLRRQGGRTDVLARLPEVTGVEHVAAVSVLFNPADASLPWKSGDILIARNQGRYPYGRSVIRLRRGFIGRIESWSSETVWSESASALSLRPLQGLALDPVGALYFSEQSSRNIFRLHRSPRGAWTAGAVASVPSNVPFGGDFALAADGKLYVSSGAGVVPGLVSKSNIRFGDPPPLDPTVEPIAWGGLYRFDEQGGGAVEGFGFYDPDRLVFADGTGAFWQKKVNPRFDPAAPAPPIVPTLPTFPPPPPTLVRYEPGASGVIRSAGPLVTAWTDYIEENPGAQEAIRWENGSSSFVSFPEWDSDAITARFRRLLHRFYGAAAAGESGPLSYLRETDPLTGKQRVAPAQIAADDTVHPDASRLIDPRDAQELMLAHLAVQLWVEVAGLTGYRAEELDYSAFDPTQSLFQFHMLQRSPHGYLHSPDRIGKVMPNDPVPALNFMLDNHLFGETPTDTVYRIGNWMRAKLHHGPPRPNGWRIPSFGYDGDAPLTSVVEKRISPYAGHSKSLYWAWEGCHTAAGMYVLLARLANIPGDTPPLWENWESSTKGQWHRGVRFAGLRLRALHSDDFYAIDSLRDPRVTADRVFNADGAMSYDEINTLTPEIVSTQDECDTSMSHYYRIVAEIGVRALAYHYLEYFWQKELHSEMAWPDDPGSCESKWTFMPGRVAAVANPPSKALPWVGPGTVNGWSQQIFCARSGDYVAFIRDFLDKHDSILRPGDFETLPRQQDALHEYRRLHGIWLADREA